MSRNIMAKRRPPPQKIAGGKFDLGKKLGGGCFGDVYRGSNNETWEDVAIKTEPIHSELPQLTHEAKILIDLQKDPSLQGFAAVHFFGTVDTYNILVMDMLGCSLEDQRKSCDGKFDAKTTLLVAQQVLQRIEYLHSRCIVHRDIKPENFMFGVGDKQHHVYLIDFGLCKRYWRNSHLPMKMKNSLTGTVIYASMNAHKGAEQSRRDDLEAIGYMLLFLRRGSLPWVSLDGKTKHDKYDKIYNMKAEANLSELSEDLPEVFEELITYSRGLEYAERPDYRRFRKMFISARDDRWKDASDHSFPWLEEVEQLRLQALAQPAGFVQPDDIVPKSSFRFCLCGGGGGVKVVDFPDAD